MGHFTDFHPALSRHFFQFRDRFSIHQCPAKPRVLNMAIDDFASHLD
tara:strand:- start:3911 stop:4051 length:141 start_codon:yes stop_codon:yes gene_type:complete